MNDELCPVQQVAFDTLMRLVPIGNVLVVYGGSGSGKTTMLRKAHQLIQSAFLNMKDFIDAMRDYHPLALEETFEQLLMNALQTNDVVMVDDLHLLYNVVCCNGGYPRLRLLEAPLTTLTTYAVETGKKLIFASDANIPRP